MSPAERNAGSAAASTPCSRTSRRAALPVEASCTRTATSPGRSSTRTKLDELAESIRTQGVIQPLVVTPDGDGTYTIIAGERRWRASQRPASTQVPVVVREVADDRELLELALVENLQRSDLNPVEEAEAYRTLATTFDLSQEEIARRVGKSRSTVANALRLLNLPAEIQEPLRTGPAHRRSGAAAARHRGPGRQLELASGRPPSAA